jgi:hypothetical protein
VLFHWQYVTPFGIPDALDFIAPPPPTLGSMEYTKDYAEVKRVGSAPARISRTGHRTARTSRASTPLPLRATSGA